MRYAITLESEQSFRRAALACHISQSGLSMQIQKLEELLDIVLFDRTKRPLFVTEEGARALKQMRAVLQETERLGQIVSEEDGAAGPFRLGVIPTLSPTIIPLFLAEFLEHYPRVELSIEELKTSEIIARLQADTLDAGLAATPLHIPGLHEDVLGQEVMVAYLSPHDPLLRKKSVTQKDLTERELWVMPEGHCFRTQVLSYCGAKGVKDPGALRFESGSFQTLTRLVDEGLGATILPLLAADFLAKGRRESQMRPLVAPVPVREIGLVSARGDLRRRVRKTLIEMIRRNLASSLPSPPKHAELIEPLA